MSIANRMIWTQDDIDKFAAMELPKLTAKQRAFVSAYEELNFTNAGKAAINAGYKGKWPRAAGNEFANHPTVALYCNIRKARSLSNVATSQQNLTDILKDIAGDPNVAPTARALAVRELRQLIQAPNSVNISSDGGNGGVSINISVDKAPNTQEDILDSELKEGNTQNPTQD